MIDEFFGRTTHLLRDKSLKEGPMKRQISFAARATLFAAIGAIGVAPAWAQNGVIAFREACTGGSALRIYVMRGEAESDTNPRVLLPLPGLLNGVQYGQALLDVSTSGPVTVLVHGLFAVQVNDTAGDLVPDAPVNIRLAADPDLPANINDAPFAKFSPTGERVALVSDGILVIADIVRDVNQKITGLTNPTVVADLSTIGSLQTPTSPWAALTLVTRISRRTGPRS